MNSPLYNIYKTYDQNFDLGPIGLRGLKKPIFKKIKPRYSFLGFPVNLPFGIPAGPLLNSKFIKSAFDFGFDVVCYKTQRSVPFKCNLYPNVIFVDIDGPLTMKKADTPLLGETESGKKPKEYSITNSFGNPSRGPQMWQKDMEKAVSYAKKGQLLVASVVGTIQKGFSDEDYYDDFAHTAELAAKTGANIIEVNLSCPNVANEGVICYSTDAVEKICNKTRKKIGSKKLLAKIGYFTKDQNQLLEKIISKISPFIDGISTINTIAAPIVDENGNQALPGPQRLKSGVCGAGIKWAGLEMVKRLYKLRKKHKKNFSIIGVGGVMTPYDFLEYRKAGADLVQSATGAMWNPYLAREIGSRLRLEGETRRHLPGDRGKRI